VTNSGNPSRMLMHLPVNRPFPRTTGELCRYLADGVSVTKLFPVDVDQSNGHTCRATHARDGEQWIVTGPCKKFCKSPETYARHVKTAHLRGFECINGVRGSMSIIHWMQSKPRFQYSPLYAHPLQGFSGTVSRPS